MTTEQELANIKEVLGTLIAWLYIELGEQNVKTLLEKLNK